MELYVAPDGKDSNPGTKQQPFATLHRAQKETRIGHPGKITVFLRGGTYHLSEPLVFTAEDSGTQDEPVRWQAYEKETPVVTRVNPVVLFSGKPEQPVRHVVLSGIVFRSGAVTFYAAEDCGLDACRIEANPCSGIRVDDYNRRITIHGCELTCSEGGGIASIVFSSDNISDPKTANYPADCLVEDCLITSAVRISGAARITLRHCTVLDGMGPCINIDHNYWGGHIVDSCDVIANAKDADNRVAFHAGGSEGGGRSTWGGEKNPFGVQPEPALLNPVEPTTLRNSRFRCDHGWDINLRDGDSNFRISNNLLLHGGLRLGAGSQRIVENNVLPSITAKGWPENNGDVLTHNIITGGYDSTNMPAVWGKTVDANFFVHVWALADAQHLGLDKNSLVGDPQFLNALQGDYRVSDQSPALKVGFRNFPMDQFGVTSPQLQAKVKAKLGSAVAAPIYETARRNPRQMVWLGARVQNVTELGKVFAAGLSGPVGVMLMEVPPDSPAAKQGLVIPDVIVALDGKPTEDVEALRFYYDAVPPGQPIELTVMRTQREQKVKILRGNELRLGAQTVQIGGTGKARYAREGYIYQWQDVGTTLGWKAVPFQAGTYRVMLILGCAAPDAGSTFDLQIGTGKLPGTVPDTGGEIQWKSVTLGTLAVAAAGPLDVTITPTSKKGGTIMGFRSLLLMPQPAPPPAAKGTP
jgi:hypothetical protein